MKINLDNVTIIIHFRRDIIDRYKNLVDVLSYYKMHTTGLSVIIINDDKKPDAGLKELHDMFGCKILFFNNNGTYHRTKCFNDAANEASTDYVIFGDTDIIIDPKHIKSATELFIDPNVGIVFPYNGMFVEILGSTERSFRESYDSTILDDLYIPHIIGHRSDNFSVSHTKSEGGSVMFRLDTFKEIGGYNPNFRGWGYEDNEISNRVKLFGYQIDRVMDKDAIAWHLPHPNTIRNLEPQYSLNRQEYEKVSKMGKEDIIKYKQSWNNEFRNI
jgi:predicted glycosyltransferase involved in capsule biosynthesis